MITMRMKESFFDRTVIKDATDAAKRRNLSKTGAFIRQSAKSSIRQRKGTSRPGQPPSSHVGTLRDLIFFAYDRASDSVVIGPELVAGSGGNPITATLEFGGRIVLRHVLQTSGRSLLTRIIGASATIKPRPYMGPAMRKELPGFVSIWKASINGA